jgi:TolB-like protein/DNA-binding winged helix-turn-helix (wHTH) protein
MNGTENHRAYEFSGFRLDAARRQLFSPDGQPVTLNPRAFNTLLYFVEHRSELLDKATLMQAVWPDTVVEENNLNQAISALRRALEDKPGEHRFILTEPGRGYRFVADVKSLEPKTQSAGSLTEATEAELRPAAAKIRKLRTMMPALIVVLIAIGSYVYLRQQGAEPEPGQKPEQVVIVSPVRSIAVLPFVDMSPNKDQEYFSDGIAVEMMNQLSKLRGLHVAGRTSSFYFKGKNEDFNVIGEKLGVAHILEGSVRKAGNRVRISVQLVKVADGYHLWSESFDRDLNDIFAIQEETARAVADALSITLGVGESEFGAGGTRNFAAYDAYLAGLSLSNQLGRENTARAIEQLEKAVALDPAFAHAWGVLALVYNDAATVFFSERAGEFYNKFEAAAARAIAIAPDAIASVQAEALLQTERRDWTAAEQSYKKALELAPADSSTNAWYGAFLLDAGRPREVIEYVRRADRTDPLSLWHPTLLGLAHEYNDDYDEALKEIERGQGLIGDHALLNVATLTLAMTIGDRAMMEASLEKIVNDDLLPSNNRSLNETMRPLLDSPEEARKDLHRFYTDPAYNSPVTRGAIAVWASYFGDHELALKAYHESSEARVFNPSGIWQPIHKPMRQLPGFKDLVRDLGLVDYWRTAGTWGDFCRPFGEDDFECE